MFGKALLSSVICWLASGFCSTTGVALESIIIPYPTASSQFTPLWFTRDVGLYEKY